MQGELSVRGGGDGVAVVVPGSQSTALLDPEHPTGLWSVAPIPATDAELEDLLGAPHKAGSWAHALQLDQRQANPRVVVVVAVSSETRSYYVR